MASLADKLLAGWRTCQKLPWGKQLFSRYLGFFVPYTGTMGATVMALAPGEATVQLKQRRKVSNHLHSVHAIALANLGELATGLAVITAAPTHAKSILVGFQISYVKKARGVLSASAQASLPDFTDELEHLVQAEITDNEGDVVAEVQATWRFRIETDS